MIYYEHFCKDVMALSDGVAKGIRVLIGEIYQNIRSSYNTFKEFFANYSKNQAFRLEDLSRFLKDFSIEVESTVLQGFFDKLKLNSNSEVLFENFRALFEKEIDSELMTLITHMGYIL
jgi:hypothetical protein